MRGLASTCSPRSTSRSIAWVSTMSTSSTATGADPETPLEETMGALHTAVVSGRALYAGISSYSPERTVAAARILADLGTPLLIHQPSYSMFNRWIESGLLDTLSDLGVGCIAFSPLAQGLLTDRYLKGIPEGGTRRAGGLDEQINGDDDTLAAIRELTAIAESRGQSLAQLAISWTLRNDGVTSALIGASSVEQLEANLASVHHLGLHRLRAGVHRRIRGRHGHQPLGSVQRGGGLVLVRFAHNRPVPRPTPHGGEGSRRGHWQITRLEHLRLPSAVREPDAARGRGRVAAPRSNRHPCV